MREELACPVPNCRNIPLIQFHNNRNKINIKCNLHENNNKLYDIKEYLENCSNQNNTLLCSNCHKKFSQTDIILFCLRCKKLFDNKCFEVTKCHNKEHKKVETNYNTYCDKILCFLHNKTFIKYCKQCKISFCNNCNIKNHENHEIINIYLKLKQKNELAHLQNKMKILEDTFNKLKKLVNEYLEENENKIKLQKLILKNYENNKFNGNSLENLNNLNLIMNNFYKEKLDALFNKRDNFEDICLGIYYFYLMCKKDINNEDKIKLNKIQNDLKDASKIKDKKEFKIINRNENINLLRKNFIEENGKGDINNRNILKLNFANINESKQKKRNNNNINENDEINSNNIKPNEPINKKSDSFLQLEKGNSLNSIIKTIIEKSKILSVTSLSTGNLALGFMNGYIKIYNGNYICLKNNKSEQDKSLILTIDKFKGRRISYIYELKNNTLLCCTFSKIHHIKLINNDKNYYYLGLIKLSKYEVPKKIIELGNDLIVSLGEKNYRDENRIHNKCIIKIFSKLNINSKNSEANSFLSDYDSIGSSNNSSSEWENLFSNEEDEPMENKEEVLMEDKDIKIYKKNKNYDNLYFCSIYGTKIVKSKEDINIYEFILTSNKIFNEGENCVIFYGVMKNFQRHGYIFFIEKKIENLSCSKMVNSICKLSTKNIGIALQKYEQNDNNGIAIIDINTKELIKVINGFSIGIIYRDFKSPYIFFSTYNPLGNKKGDQFRYVKNLDQKLDNDYLKAICDIKKKFSNIIEIKPNLGESSKNLFFFGLVVGKNFYIISVKNKI